MNCGGIVLCGGRSSRMGFPKPALPFGPECLLARVVRLLGRAVEEIVVVAARGHELPELPSGVHVTYDRQPELGPLEGLRAGLAALPDSLDAAYVTGCDVPLLVPGFVGRMIELLADYCVSVPVTDGHFHPLSAVYRRGVLGFVEALLAAGRLRPVFLFEMVPTRIVTTAELTDVDPELDTLKNLNDPSAYLTALAREGLAAPPEVLARLAEHLPRA